MSANDGTFGASRENWAAELTDAALALASRHNVHGTSVDQELELWRTLDGVVSKPKAQCRSVTPACQEHLAARLTDEVYNVILRRGFSGSFLDLRLDLWDTMRRELTHAPVAAVA
jgi:hypothetical protein